MHIKCLPTDVLLDITKYTNKNDNLQLPLISKVLPYSHLSFKNYRIDYTFTMKTLHTLIDHIDGIEELDVDGIDIFFDCQLTFPCLRVLRVENCSVKSEVLEMYRKMNVKIVLTNCRVY